MDDLISQNEYIIARAIIFTLAIDVGEVPRH